jgi:putative protein-disulfide isomerase
MDGKHMIELIQFTDPVCTWCWGSEPLLRRLETRFGDQIKSSFVMGGLVRDIRDFYDSTNDIGGTPEAADEQIARHWEEASSRHGMPVDTRDYHLFTNEYPSTYPQNIAYKAAQMENEALADKFLRRIREASSAEGRQTNAPEVLIELASEVRLGVAKFIERVGDGTAEKAFKHDQQLCGQLNIHGFPTFLVRNGEKAVLLRGWQQYETIRSVMRRLTAGEIVERDVDASDTSILAFIREHGNLAPAEIKMAFDLSDDEVESVIHRLLNQNLISKRAVGNGFFISAKDAATCVSETGVCQI